MTKRFSTILLLMAVLSFFISGTFATFTDSQTASGEIQAGYWITPTEDQGCTPGFWKQEQHFAHWPAPYTPGTAFESIFSRDVPDAPTLLAALDLGGGGLDALMRHATAGLLNAAHTGLQYPYSPEEVIAMFQSAFDSSDYEATKDLLEAANEAGCPLGSASTPTPTISLTPTTTHTPTPTSTPTHTPAPSCAVTPGAFSYPAGSQLSVTLQNNGPTLATLSQLSITYTCSGGGCAAQKLKRIDFGSATIWSGSDSNNPAAIPADSPWSGAVGDRQLAPTAAKVLLFDFQKTLATAGNSLTITFEEGCSITASN